MSTPIASNPNLTLTPSQVIVAQSEQWRQVVRQALVETRCACPGFLTEDMDATEQTVTVQLAVQERVRVVSSVKAQWWDVPPIVHVPIMMPRGGGYSVTLPLKKGDEGMVIFCDACIDNWWINGQVNSPVADNTGVSSGSQRQNEVRRHYVHDCGFYPGLWSQPNVLDDYSTDSLQIRSDDGVTIIDVSEDGVAMTGAAVTAADGGTPQFLLTDAWYVWFTSNVVPFLISKGYSGPAEPANSVTTILKGQ